MASTAGRSGLGILEMSHRNDLDPIQLIRNDIDGLVKMHIEGTFPVDEGIELERIKRNWTAHVNKLEELGLVGHDLQESLGKAFVGSAIRNGLDIDFSNEAAFVMEPFALFKDIDGGLNFIAFKYAPKGGSVEPVGEKSYVIPTHLMAQIAHSGNTRSDRRSGTHQKSNKPGNNLSYVLAGGALVLLGLLSQTPVGRSIIGKFNSSVDTSAAILNTPIATENTELPDGTSIPETPTLKPTVFVTPTDLPTEITPIPPTYTPEVPKFTEAELLQMAKELEQLSNLVNSTDDDLGVAGDNLNSSPNFFVEGKNPNSEQLKKLTQNFLNIVFSGRIDLLKGMTFPPYTFSLSPDAPSTEALSLTGQPGWVFTEEMNKQLKDAGIIIVFGGYAMPDTETKSMTAYELFGVGSNDLQIFIDGAPEIGPGGSFTWVKGLHDRRGVILGLPDDQSFLSLSSSMPSRYYLTQLKVKTSQIKIPVRSDGTLGVNAITIISTNGGRTFESIISALSNSAPDWGLGPIDGSARVKFE